MLTERRNASVARIVHHSERSALPVEKLHILQRANPSVADKPAELLGPARLIGPIVS
jgi:hypothetical protein